MSAFLFETIDWLSKIIYWLSIAAKNKTWFCIAGDMQIWSFLTSSEGLFWRFDAKAPYFSSPSSPTYTPILSFRLGHRYWSKYSLVFLKVVCNESVLEKYQHRATNHTSNILTLWSCSILRWWVAVKTSPLKKCFWRQYQTFPTQGLHLLIYITAIYLCITAFSLKIQKYKTYASTQLH